MNSEELLEWGTAFLTFAFGILVIVISIIVVKMFFFGVP